MLQTEFFCKKLQIKSYLKLVFFKLGKKQLQKIDFI